MDKEYIILEYLDRSRDVTQRQISDGTGFSLGTVNILLKKMVREGLIKVSKIPASRVAYMLTTKGMEEKLSKAYTYIRIHYAAIERTKAGVRDALKIFSGNEWQVYVAINRPEMREIVQSVAGELAIFVRIHNPAVQDDPNMVLICDRDELIAQYPEAKVINIVTEILKK